MSSISVHMTDTRNNNVYVYIYDCNDTDNICWIWSRGNYSCDCNRAIFMYGDHDFPCNIGDNVIIIDKIVDNNTNDILYKET